MTVIQIEVLDEWFAEWKDRTWGKRGEDYETFKSALGERLMQHLYDKLPQLQGRVDYYEVSTPLSTDWFSGYRQGEWYGLAHTAERLQQTWWVRERAFRDCG
jgi:all-trans-retinol 13,14-reductase